MVFDVAMVRRFGGVAVLIAGLLVGAAACTGDSTSSATTVDAATREADEARARSDVAPFVGQPLAEFITNASALGYSVQTAYINEGGFGEYRPKRVRVLVDDGIVVEVVAVG